MDISVKGKKLGVGDALRGHVENHLKNAVSKYFNHALDASVTFSREAYRIRADISLRPGPRGLIVQGGSDSDDPYAAFDRALERIAKQLRRYKRRVTNHHKGHGHDDALSTLQYVVDPEKEDEEMSKDAQPAIIAEMTTEIATLSVSEAVMRMDLSDVRVVMFQNKASGGMNVVYRRHDGNVGWIDPANSVERTGSYTYVRPLDGRRHSKVRCDYGDS